MEQQNTKKAPRRHVQLKAPDTEVARWVALARARDVTLTALIRECLNARVRRAAGVLAAQVSP